MNRFLSMFLCFIVLITLPGGEVYSESIGEYRAALHGEQDASGASVVAVSGLTVPAGKRFLTTVSASTKIADGATIQVVSDQAMTYPTSTKNNVPNAAYYPLPKGARDTVVGSRIAYKKNNTTYYYYNLKSGVRVSAVDIKAASGDPPSRNTVQSLWVESNKNYTYVYLDTRQKVTYKVKYASGSISFQLQNTQGNPEIQPFPASCMFSGVEWQKGTLTLKFSKPGSFMGYKGYYDKRGNLVLRFNNMPTSISKARIAVDAGHGGSDKGAIGSDSNYHEKDINLAIANQLAAELEDRGATVILLGGNNQSGHKRREQAEKWEADILISIHTNSSTNKKAAGTEVFYYQSFNKSMAVSASSEVSSALDTGNRGAKRGIYHVTLSSQMRSILIETGFMSNQTEYQKLTQSGYHKNIANGIADAVEKIFGG